MNQTPANDPQRTPLIALPPAVSALHRIGTLIAVVVPLAALIVAVIGLWGWGVTWVELTVLGIMYLATGLGITVGYHRLLTHRSFETFRPIRIVLAILGSMSVQGPVLQWVATHRRHHQHSDQPDDPHSPHCYGRGVFRLLAGWWHAHMGWMFTRESANILHYARDLYAELSLRIVHRLAVVWILLGLLIPAAIGGWITGSWTGALLGFLWGGLVRVFLVHHVTFSINSVCHIWGSQPFSSRDHSRNNFLCGLLALGEGWHNNHHAFPTSARHGLRWWQVDFSFLFIRLLSLVGLAWRVRTPGQGDIAAKLGHGLSNPA